jgi:hypothetical protein
MNDSIYLKYLKIKSTYGQCYYRGYNIKQILGSDLMPFLQQRSFNGIKLKSMNFIYNLYSYSRTIETFYNYEKNTSGIIISNQFPDREDYSDYLNILKPLLNFNKVIDYRLREIKKINVFNLNSIKNFFFTSFEVMVTKKGKVKEKLYLIAILSKIKNTIDHLELCNLNKVTSFIAFNSSAHCDVYLTEYFNKRNITTYSLQHGYYAKFKNEVKVDVLNYENISAKYFFAWDNYTKTLIREFNKDVKVIIAGNPRFSKVPVNFNLRFQKCLVLLPGISYHKSNLKLLEEISKLSESGIKISVKLHPSLERFEYFKLCEKYNFKMIKEGVLLNQLLKSNEVDFCITFNSSVYFESLYHGKICFRYASCETMIFSDQNDCFDDVNEIKTKIKILKNSDSNKLINELKKFISKKYTPILNYTLLNK